MRAPFEDMSALDRLIHEPARLAILTALSACRGCDFTFLLSVTGLTKGNLSNHLQKLQDGQLINIEKRFKGRMPQTMIRLTPKGQTGIERHWRRLEEFRAAARDWAAERRDD
jgi:DNA-binding transcriptional ArsR family regulator